MWAGEGRRRALLQLTVQKSPLIPQLPHNPFGGTLTLFRFRYSLEPHLLKCRGTKQPSYPYGGFLKMGVHPNHSFSIINQPSLDTPILRNPHMKAMKHSLRSTKCGSQDVVVSQSTMFSGQCFNIRGFIWQGQLQKMYERWTGCALSEPQMAVNVLTTVPTRTLQSPSVYLKIGYAKIQWFISIFSIQIQFRRYTGIPRFQADPLLSAILCASWNNYSSTLRFNLAKICVFWKSVFFSNHRVHAWLFQLQWVATS